MYSDIEEGHWRFKRHRFPSIHIDRPKKYSTTTSSSTTATAVTSYPCFLSSSSEGGEEKR
ncbi:hypothetical protein EYF80_057569 [Liparis tanakae]|uniref:Uncharacterized protein n=1 Tax=Liparis tanakae TaxID=230148 RepID=A0A4Z2EUM5_9TELE|nr:hypothetical protein EYF80_057569 [Liparis tanakae]